MAEPSTSIVYLLVASLTGAAAYVFNVQPYVLLAALMGTLIGLAISKTGPVVGIWLLLVGICLGGYATPWIMSATWATPSLERFAGFIVPLISIGFRAPVIEGCNQFIGVLFKLAGKWLAKWGGIAGGEN
jgi:hypothetical protein